MDTKNKLFVVIGTVAILGTAGMGGYALFTLKDPAIDSTTTVSSTNTTDSPTTSTNDSPASTSTGSYKNGTYTASTSYMVPRGTNTINVTLTIVDGVITSISTKHTSNDHESALYIDSFDSDIDDATTGESLSGFSVSRIGGASLTTDAFNDVLDTIRTDAAV